MLHTMGMSILEDAGHAPFAELPGRPAFTDHLRDRQAGDPTTIQWPALERPTWP